MLSNTWLGSLLLLCTISAGLSRGSGVVATPEGDPSPISSTLEGPLTGIPASKGVLPKPIDLGGSVGGVHWNYCLVLVGLFI